MFRDIHRLSHFRGDARESEEGETQVGSDQEEEDTTRQSVTAESKAVMEKLCSLFPHKFLSENISNVLPAGQKVFSLNHNSTPVLKLNPILAGSWLSPPKVGENQVGLWPENTTFPKGVNPYTKGYGIRPPPRPTDISIMDPNLKLLLEAPKIKEANLNSTVFRTKDAVKLVNFSHPSTDLFQRGGLFDIFYSDELVSCAIDVIPVIREELSQSFEDIDLSAFDFLSKLLALISLSNQRSFHNQMAALVSNKMGMRDAVLNKFKVPANTSKFLRGSDFACEGVFGDLPKEFLDKFSSVNGDHLVCRPKPNNFTNTKAGGSNYFNNLLSNDGKRMASTSGAQANKKQKTSYDSSSWVFSQVPKNHKGGGNSSGRGKFRGRGQKRS